MNKNFEREIIEIRRRLHQCAEIGFELTRTREIVNNELERLALEVKTCANG